MLWQKAPALQNIDLYAVSYVAGHYNASKTASVAFTSLLAHSNPEKEDTGNGEFQQQQQAGRRFVYLEQS